MFAAKRPQRAAHLAQEALTLVFVDAHDFIEQPEVITGLPRDRPECHHILRKARTAVADARIQKSASDARVGAHAVHDLIHIRAHRFANRCHRIDERNLHCKKSVRRVLDQLRALAGGHDDRRRNRTAIRLRDRVAALVVAAVGQWSINFAEHIGRPCAVAADHDPVGKQKIRDRRAFA